MKKNDKVIALVNGEYRKATVLGSPYLMYAGGERFVEVYMHDTGLEIPVKLSNIKKIGE